MQLRPAAPRHRPEQTRIAGVRAARQTAIKSCGANEIYLARISPCSRIPLISSFVFFIENLVGAIFYGDTHVMARVL